MLIQSFLYEILVNFINNFLNIYCDKHPGLSYCLAGLNINYLVKDYHFKILSLDLRVLFRSG